MKGRQGVRCWYAERGRDREREGEREKVREREEREREREIERERTNWSKNERVFFEGLERKGGSCV